MSEGEFFELLLQELRENANLRNYYQFLNSSFAFGFRKNYFLQRLAFLNKHVPRDPGLNIWDCGCGFGTQGIFLSLNGIRSRGSTLQFYMGQIPARLHYWRRHGDVSRFSYHYENIFDVAIPEQSLDIILVEDTLHHLEPIELALAKLSRLLRPDGKLIVIEENGDNLIQSLILLRRRGTRRVVQLWDEQLQRHYLMGDENIRNLATWRRLLGRHGLAIDDGSLEYIRFFLPPFYRLVAADRLLHWERSLWRRWPVLRDYFFFGINFVARPRQA